MSKLGTLLVAMDEDHPTLKHFAFNANAAMAQFEDSEDKRNVMRKVDVRTLQAAPLKSELLMMTHPQAVDPCAGTRL